MEQILIDYLTNATWQIPLLAGGAWLFIRIGKFGPRTQHSVWLAVLALAVGLPLRGVRSGVLPLTQDDLYPLRRRRKRDERKGSTATGCHRDPVRRRGSSTIERALHLSAPHAALVSGRHRLVGRHLFRHFALRSLSEFWRRGAVRASW